MTSHFLEITYTGSVTGEDVGYYHLHPGSMTGEDVEYNHLHRFGDR